MNKIAVILLNYNSSNDCRHCVESLKKQKDVELEIIIVDNASHEGDRSAVEELCKEQDCTFIVAEENRGYNAGNNIGLRYAADKGYDFALIANPDMLFPQSDYVSTLLETIRKDDEIVVCGSDVVELDGKHLSPMKREGGWEECFVWVKYLFKKAPAIREDLDSFTESHYCSKLCGCCFMLRMDFIRSIHFFDEGVFLFGEEAILSRQVERSGKKMFYTSEIQALHAHVLSKKGSLVNRLKAWKKSRLYFIDHYSDDGTLGRFVCKLSMNLYFSLLIFKNKIKNLKNTK